MRALGMARTAAQKAATRRMIAANRARRNGRRSVRSTRGVGGAGFRRKMATHTYGGAEAAGAGVAGYGLVGQKPSAGGTSVVGFLKQGDASSALYQLKESVPFLGKDSAMTTNRATVGTGVAVAVGAKVARHFFPFLHRWKVKVGRHTAIAVA